MAKDQGNYNKYGRRLFEEGRLIRDLLGGMALMCQSVCVISTLPFELDNPTKWTAMGISLAISGLGLLRTGYVLLDYVAGNYGYEVYDWRGNITNKK